MKAAAECHVLYPILSESKQEMKIKMSQVYPGCSCFVVVSKILLERSCGFIIYLIMFMGFLINIKFFQNILPISFCKKLHCVYYVVSGSSRAVVVAFLVVKIQNLDFGFYMTKTFFKTCVEDFSFVRGAFPHNIGILCKKNVDRFNNEATTSA